ncbi:NUDIX hydrolase [Arthrobacter gengyunqii]|uniref:NUDIX hydrolase n=1 Tax=Arthrobacter gengyunqii TaxID=2886940 RepID=A0A9X1LYL0_9MICC|nr:NUDIX hydrolase [Arthrobacter gengyunqii]MCC3268103.1 NUDIX hydrolase [Arthrobacter gengyunqii]UOY95520.1 NUDIX hydrolase [Arthrobacter gengyunqii]
MAEGFDTRVGAYAVVIRDGSVLLSHWHDHGYSGWTLPGGGLELREDAPAAVVREVREETGYFVEAEELLGVDSIFIEPEHRFPGEHRRLLHALRIIYRARVLSGTLTHELDGSTDEAAWVPLEQVPELGATPLVQVGLKMAAIRTAVSSE